jgi:kumamolisin
MAEVPEQRVPIPGSELSPRGEERWVSTASGAEEISATLLLRHAPGAARPSAEEMLSGQYHVTSRAAMERALQANPDDLNAVRTFASEHGLKVVDESAEMRRVRVEGTADQISAAFGVQLGWVEMAGRRFLTYKGSISIPQQLAGIVTGVLGLDQRPAARHA